MIRAGSEHRLPKWPIIQRTLSLGVEIVLDACTVHGPAALDVETAMLTVFPERMYR